MVQRRSSTGTLRSGVGAARYRTRYGWPQSHTPGNPAALRVAPQPEHSRDQGRATIAASAADLRTGMQSIEDPLRQLAREPGQGRNLGRRRGLHARERAESLEQRTSPAWPDPRYREQLRGDGAPRTAVAAVANGEPVRLVAAALQQLERRAAS